MLGLRCLAALTLVLALIRGKEPELIVSVDPSLPEGLLTEQIGGLLGFN